MQNKDVAKKLGIGPVFLSRLRSGSRKPSVNLIIMIERRLGWTVSKQLTAYRKDQYAAKFREFLEQEYDIPDHTKEEEEEEETE